MPDVVTVDCRVRVRYEEDGLEEEYKVVSLGAEDPAHGCISSKTPIGRAILGAKEGEVRRYAINQGEVEVRIVKIF